MKSDNGFLSKRMEESYSYLFEEEALRWSAMNGYLSIVKFLVNKGANIHAEDDYALKWSVYNGYLPIVKFLVSKGANIHANNDLALRWSVREGHLPVVEFLKNEMR